MIVPRVSLLALACLAGTVAAHTTEPPAAPPMAIAPLPEGSARLTAGPLLEAFETNRRYVASFEPDRLLWTFRRNAGLPTPGAPLGGWEGPEIELRGHSIGHYLSACAHILRHAEDEEIRRDARAVVQGLADCQKALGTGYLSAFPEEFLDRVENGRAVWAPYYTIHKILAGLVSMHQLAGDAQALEIARGMAAHIEGRCARLDDAAMQRMLGNEFGGMHEALLDLFASTGDQRHRALANRFQKRVFLDPLLRGEDPLPGLHANTHLAQIEGQARAYELTGDPQARAIVERFWSALHEDHSYATGGSNSGEYWGPPGRLAATLSATNQEFCTSYNWARITRSLLLWTGDARYADELERIFHNGITVSQHPTSGMLLYYLPLATGLRKDHGTPFDTMTCCYGTGIEAYAQLADGIYFTRGDDLVVARFTGSTLRWTSPRAGAVELTQATTFPERGASSLRFTAVERPTEFAVLLRYPWWASDGMRVTVNGEPVAVSGPRGQWIEVRRRWTTGDRIEIDLPMPLRVVTMPDDPGLGAIMAGPLVLAGLVTEPTDLPTAPIVGDKLAASAWLEPTGAPLTWRTKGMPEDRTFVPLERIVGERYGVYWPFGVPGGARQKAYDEAVAARADRERRTVDQVQPGDEGSEREHGFAGAASRSGEVDGRRWRDATVGGHIRYRLAVDPERPCVLALTYFDRDGGARVFDLLIDGTRIASERLVGGGQGQFPTVEYPIPATLTAGRQSVELRIEPAPNGEIAGGIFGVRLLRRP
jgi:DUF1680 family protein